MPRLSSDFDQGLTDTNSMGEISNRSSSPWKNTLPSNLKTVIFSGGRESPRPPGPKRGRHLTKTLLLGASRFGTVRLLRQTVPRGTRDGTTGRASPSSCQDQRVLMPERPLLNKKGVAARANNPLTQPARSKVKHWLKRTQNPAFFLTRKF